MRDKFFRTIGILLFFLTLSVHAGAQTIEGYVIDAQTKDTLMFPSASYKGNHVAVSGNALGHYSIARHEGWYLTFSAVGYESRRILIKKNTPTRLDVKLKPVSQQLNEVKIVAHKGKYSRKDNPAVELMKRVIAAKKKTDLRNHDFLQYDKYQKLTLALNDIKPEQMDTGFFAKKPWLKEQIERSPYNNKLTLPLSVDETVTKYLYRKDPKEDKNIILGQNSTGVNQMIQTGDILNVAMKDVFTDVDIYEDYVRLLQYPFPSPIGKTAISFYHFYIQDTVYVDNDLCYHLQFIPANIQDFGFRGEIYVLADSSLHVKRCDLTIPKRSDVNFVENLQISQSYTRLPNGEWALSSDDMIVEMSVAKFLSKVLVTRVTRLSDYSFDPIQPRLLKGKAKTKREANSMMRDEAFWNQYRTVELTKGESGMDAFIHRIEQLKGFKYVIFGAKALIENFVETGGYRHPSKVDIGPINTMLTHNFIDGFRTRLSLQTTANLSKHWFFGGYYAYGWSPKKHYYKGEVTYSFNKKDYLPREFPKRTLTFTSSYDVVSPSDKFVNTDKDNVFTALKWTTVDKMMFYNRQQLKFEWEDEWGMSYMLLLKTEGNEAAGRMGFQHLSDIAAGAPSLTSQLSALSSDAAGDYLHNGKIRTTELGMQFQLAPGRTYINTKQRRLPINLDAPVFTVGHTMGFKGLLGGEQSGTLYLIHCFACLPPI